eukprot:11971660-Karenia_brevis.AAC.1
MCHPVPSATLHYFPLKPENSSVGTLGDCGVSAREGRPEVDSCFKPFFHDNTCLSGTPGMSQELKPPDCSS